MNSTFKTIALLLAAAFPTAFTAECLGVNLPTAFNSAHAFGAFVIALTVLIMWADYAPAKRLVPCTESVPANPQGARVNLQLAA